MSHQSQVLRLSPLAGAAWPFLNKLHLRINRIRLNATCESVIKWYCFGPFKWTLSYCKYTALELGTHTFEYWLDLWVERGGQQKTCRRLCSFLSLHPCIILNVKHCNISTMRRLILNPWNVMQFSSNSNIFLCYRELHNDKARHVIRLSNTNSNIRRVFWLVFSLTYSTAVVTGNYLVDSTPVDVI